MTRSDRMAQGLLVAALTVLSALPLLRGFFAPYVTPADNNTAAFAQPARNYLRHGLLGTRMGLMHNLGDAPGARPAYNTHHPPLMSLATAAVFLLTGVSDWAARVFPAICSIGSALLLFVIWRRHRGAAPAAAAALMMAALPAFGYFGKMLGEEAPTLLFALMTVALFQRWKETSPPGGARIWTLSYAAGCLSGWAAFYVGPLLIMDAAITLRKLPAMRRRAIAGLSVTALLCFALILGHVAVLTGSFAPLIDAARNRIVAPAQNAAHSVHGGREPWLEREAGFFHRLFGSHAVLLLAGGLLAGVVALARRRANAQAAAIVALLAGLGLAHALLFPWAAYYHDWLLFHLLPLLAVAGAEGLFLIGGAVKAGLRRARAPARLAGLVGSGLILAGLAGHTVLSVKQAGLVEREPPCPAWPLIGRAISRLTPGEANVMANVAFLDAPLRFYADRPASTVLTIEDYDRFVALRRYDLYVRDLNVPIDAELERRLAALPCVEVAAFEMCALVPGSGTASAVAAEALASPPRRRLAAGIEATFGEALRLAGYEVAAPPARAARASALERFFGLADRHLLQEKILRVSSDWTVLQTPSPPWRITTVMTVEPPDTDVSLLPPVALPLHRDRIVPPPDAGSRMKIESAFFLPDDAPDSWIHLRWGVGDGSGTVRPVMPGPPRPDLKVVVSEPITLFGSRAVR